MEALIEFAPVQALHFIIHIVKLAICPVYDCVEIGLNLVDVLIAAMSGHVTIYVTFAHPFKSCCQELLTISGSLYIRFPFLNVRILRIRELFLAFRDKWSAVDGIQLLLVIEWNARNVDSLKPFFDFFLCMFTFAFADINQ